MKVIGEEQVQRMAANDLGSALRNGPTSGWGRTTCWAPP